MRFLSASGADGCCHTTRRSWPKVSKPWRCSSLSVLRWLCSVASCASTSVTRASALFQRCSSSPATTASTSAPTEYFVDLLFRPGPGAATASGQRPASDTVGIAPAGAQSALSSEARAEVNRILVRSVAQGRLDDNDRAYLAQVVAARTGLSPDEAQRRVAEVETKARDAADKAAKAGAYLSFWTFMALLFGGTAATLAGMLGGSLRDAEGRVA